VTSDGTPGETPPEPRQVRLDFRSGGWLLLLGGVLAAGTVASMIRASPARGARADVRALAPWLVPAGEVVQATSPEALPPLVDPPLLSAAEADAYRLPEHGRLLVPGDLVIGLEVGEERCAYPLRVLAWHEVVDHLLGGRALAVTYSPLCESVRVFERPADGPGPLVLRASGALWNSNPLLESTASAASTTATSLWSQLQGRAVAGPAAAAGLRLAPAPYALTTWGEWRALHPDTRVIAPDPARLDRYRGDPYSSYAGSDLVRFPVSPLPPATSGLANKAPVVAVGPPGRRVVYPLAWLPVGEWRTTQDGVALTLRHYDGPPRVEVAGAPADWEVVHASWFAWYSQLPDDARLVSPRP
jgi:hypothetical protein